MILMYLLGLAYPDPALLGDRDFTTRAATHQALTSLPGALVAWWHTPKTPEAAWRRARIVGDVTRRFDEAWYDTDLLMRLLWEDPTRILVSPRHFCRQIDEYGGLFWMTDSYHWAALPTSDPTWTIDRDLITVAREAAWRYVHERQ